MLKLSRLFHLLLVYAACVTSLVLLQRSAVDATTDLSKAAADFEYNVADDDISITNVASGDLLVGRKRFAIAANSTCSYDELSCGNEGAASSMCVICKEGIANVIKNDLLVTEANGEAQEFESGPGINSESDQIWWTSRKGDEQVEIKITLEALFTMERLRIKFKTPSPDALFIERSKDFANTWTPIAYYASNCSRFFPDVPVVDEIDKSKIKSDLDHLENEPFCVNKYDSASLSLFNSTYLIFYDDYELIYRPSSVLVDEDLLILAKRFNMKPTSAEAENRNYDLKLLLKKALAFTSLRITFVKFPTTSIKSSESTAELTSPIDRGKSTPSKEVGYEIINQSTLDYYSINEINLNGNCYCNGHGIKCRPLDYVKYDFEPNRIETVRENDKLLLKKKKKIVNAKCVCDHHTDGTNCEKCLPFYNDRQWMPALSKYEPNVCKKCECNNHSASCHFDENVYRRRNMQIEANGDVFDGQSTGEDAGGGVCHDCLDNTDGLSCEKCRVGFYRDHDYPITHSDACKKCTCNLMGTKNLDVVNGKLICATKNCECKQFVQGVNCNMCKNGYWNLSFELENGCQKCNCNPIGTLDNLGCDKLNGECYPCKRFVYGTGCTKCITGYYGLNESKYGCKPCGCSIHGSKRHWQCHEVTGQCDCKPNMKGRKCDQVENGYVCPFGMASSSSAESLPEVCKKCSCPNIKGMNFASSCYYYGESGAHNSSQISPNNVAHFEGHFFKCNCLIGFTGDRCLECENGHFGSPIAGIPCKKCDCNNNINRNDPSGCDKLTGACLKCQYNTTGSNCERCKPGFFGDARKQTCSPCKCNKSGTQSCDSITGKCICYSNVVGDDCSQCSPSSRWTAGEQGCVECDCDVEGTVDGSSVCDQSTGQCLCREGRSGLKCNERLTKVAQSAENTTQTVSRSMSAGTSWRIRFSTQIVYLLLAFSAVVSLR